MAMKADQEGFLLGDGVKMDSKALAKAVEIWRDIKKDTHAIRAALGVLATDTLRSKIASPARRAPAPLVSDRQAAVIGARIARAITPTAVARRVVETSAAALRTVAPAVMPKRDPVTGRFVATPAAAPARAAPAANSAMLQNERREQLNRDRRGRFSKGGDNAPADKPGRTWRDLFDFGGKKGKELAKSLREGARAAGENAENIDPVIKAGKEIAEVGTNIVGAVKTTAGLTKATAQISGRVLKVGKGVFAMAKAGFGFGKNVVGILTGKGDKNTPILKQIAKEMKAMNRRAGLTDGNSGSGVLSGLMGGLMTRLLPLVAVALPVILGGLAATISGAIGNAIGGWIYDKFEPQITKMVDGTVGAFKDASTYIKDKWDGVVAGFSSVIEWIANKFGIAREFVKQNVDKAKAAAKPYADAARETASKTKQSALERYDSTVESLRRAGSNVSRKLKIGSAANNEKALMNAMSQAGITDPSEQAMFMAQMDHESMGFSRLEESFNYRSADRIMAVNSRARAAGMDKVNAAMAQGPAAVAELMYGGRKDLGNTEKGDGYRFRGRGFTQLTGRANYAAAGKALGIDLLRNPELAADPQVSAKIATWFWKSRGLGDIGKVGDVELATRKINGGTNGLADRRELYYSYLDTAKAGGLNVATPRAPMSAGATNNIASKPPVSGGQQSAALPPSATTVPSAPSVPQRLAGSTPPLRATVEVRQPVSQNPSDRGIAQVANGGLGSTYRS